MIAPKLASLLSCMLLIVGCAAVSAGDGVPGVLDTPNSESHTLIVQAIAELLGHEVLIADDAFTTSDRLIVEPTRLRDAQGQLLQGREVRPPVQFLLVKNGNACAVMREDSRKLKQLAGVRCRDYK